MLLSVVQIGNSRGIRIPKAILEQCNIRDQIDLEVKNGKIILDPVQDSPRREWDEAFRKMAENGDDTPLIQDNVDIDAEDWEW